MKFVMTIMLALVAMVGMAAAVVDSNTVAANGAAQGASNSFGVSIYTGSSGYGGYPYYYDYYYPYGGYGGYTNVNVYNSQDNYQSANQLAANVNVGGSDGVDGQSAEPTDNVPASDTSGDETAEPTAAPVVAQVAVAPNGMQMVDGGQNLQSEQMDSPMPLEYVTYMDYNVLVVETRGVPTDVAQKFAVAAMTNHGYKAVYFAQGLLVHPDGSMENETLDLTSPPRVARSLGYL